MLDFHNLSKLGVLCVTGSSPLSLVHLKQLSSLKALTIIDSSNAFCLSEDDIMSNINVQLNMSLLRSAMLMLSDGHVSFHSYAVSPWEIVRS